MNFKYEMCFMFYSNENYSAIINSKYVHVLKYKQNQLT